MRLPLFLSLAAILSATPALAVDDGPRAYFPLPTGTSTINLMGIFQASNSSVDAVTAVKGAKVNVDVGVLQVSRTFDVGGNAAGLFAVMPFGEVRGEATLAGPFGNEFVRRTSSGGLGDISIAGVLGIVGSPALTRPQYVRHVPGFSLGALLMVTAPTGEYDRAKLINLGTNRWSFRIGAPMGWALGGSYLSPELTTIEVVPSVTFYTVNDAPFRAGRRSQAALFRVEGHVTHNFSRAFWASLDLTGNSGGATTTDGLADRNTRTWMGAGITAGMNFSPAFGVTATYGGVIAGNSNAPDGDGFRVNLRYSF
ncbi:transporter [Sandaracinobacteroides saxicola]|uniref:Transporter n=1 Tax=Sandaracinobacteroides saxicola TaxID=2759707 RepID=A0A7G5IDR3_9SPHN|nr:transporter [Sandaracinobacteroides saxicola]QMW21505.1 transporter [Sandaracinobacteroides saxicola]